MVGLADKLAQPFNCRSGVNAYPVSFVNSLTRAAIIVSYPVFLWVRYVSFGSTLAHPGPLGGSASLAVAGHGLRDLEIPSTNLVDSGIPAKLNFSGRFVSIRSRDVLAVSHSVER